MAGNPEEELDVFTEEQREILKQRINVGVRGKDDERVFVPRGRHTSVQRPTSTPSTRAHTDVYERMCYRFRTPGVPRRPEARRFGAERSRLSCVNAVTRCPRCRKWSPN